MRKALRFAWRSLIFSARVALLLLLGALYVTALLVEVVDDDGDDMEPVGMFPLDWHWPF